MDAHTPPGCPDDDHVPPIARARREAGGRIADPAGHGATLQRVAARLSPEQSVLEIGCGTSTTDPDPI